MNILLRKYDGKYYVKKEAVLNSDGRYLLTETGADINQTNILAVYDDARIGYVRCSYCGELVRNDPESIETHYNTREASRNCLECDKLAIYGDVTNHVKNYVHNGDGTYNATETYVTRLGCRMTYYKEDIHSKNVVNNCKYFRCRKSGMQPIDDIFVQYPNPFVKQITTDVLVSKNYELEGYHNGFYVYDMKLRGALKACVNECGIVDHYIVSFRSDEYEVYYSDTYNRLFVGYYRRYKDNLNDFFSEHRQAQALNKIAQLYEEVNKNEQE